MVKENHMSLKGLDSTVDRLQANVEAARKGIDMVVFSNNIYLTHMPQNAINKMIESYIRYIINTQQTINRLDDLRHKK